MDNSKLEIKTLHKADLALRKAIPLNPDLLDCCINGCVCFVGPFADKSNCEYCGEARYNSNGKPRSSFEYWSPLKHIRIEMLSESCRTEFLYRYQFSSKYPPAAESDIIKDFFNGKHFHDIITGTSAKFTNEFDFCFSVSTDGFQAFKK